MFNFLKNISPPELIILVLILVILFGARTAVAVGQTSGKVVREIKRIKREFTAGDDNKSSSN